LPKTCLLIASVQYLAKRLTAIEPVDLKRLVVPRRTWRLNVDVARHAADATQVGSVDFDPTSPAPLDAGAGEEAKALPPAPVMDWRSSSWDLLNGVEIRDHSEAIPPELFKRLFEK
jgi:hypothetical protein